MKKNIFAAAVLAGLTCHLAIRAGTAADDASKWTNPQKMGYAFGINLGSNLKARKIPVDGAFVAKGMETEFAGKPGLIPNDKLQALLDGLKTGDTNIPVDSKDFKNFPEEAGYAVGFNYAESLKSRHLEPADLDVPMLGKGVQDGMDGKADILSTNDVNAALKVLQEKVVARIEAQATENSELGAAFLAKNKTAPGVVTLTNGLEYKILKEGTGPKPTENSTVTVNYRGTLINGEEFDASKPGNPISFPVTRVIKGWTEILQLMPTGSKWQVYIPANLAYGANPPPGAKIGPGSALIFDIELLSFK